MTRHRVKFAKEAKKGDADHTKRRKRHITIRSKQVGNLSWFIKAAFKRHALRALGVKDTLPVADSSQTTLSETLIQTREDSLKKMILLYLKNVNEATRSGNTLDPAQSGIGRIIKNLAVSVDRVEGRSQGDGTFLGMVKRGHQSKGNRKVVDGAELVKELSSDQLLQFCTEADSNFAFLYGFSIFSPLKVLE